MKFLVLICILIKINTVYSQKYDAVDIKVNQYPEFENIETLAIRIQNDFDDEEIRIRAAFYWVATNLYYDKSFETIFRTKKLVVYSNESSKNYQLKMLLKNKTENTFKTKRGVCEDYSLLLDKLLKLMGFDTMVLYGTTKYDIEINIPETIYKNHTWNAVWIDQEWKLMDPTWASGYLNSQTNRFVREFNEHYFFTTPDIFIKNHYPIDSSWQLLDSPITLTSFLQSPIYYPTYFTENIQLIPRNSGIVNVNDDGFIEIELNSKKKSLYYKFNNETTLRKLLVRKSNNNISKSHIKLHKNKLDVDYLTLFSGNNALVTFKVDTKELVSKQKELNFSLFGK